jgi:hypothetical protein
MRSSMFALMWLCSLLIAPAGVAQVQFPGAGSVGLEPPAGMVASSRFSGFEDAGSGASILIAQMPAEAFAQLEAGFTPEALLQKGIIAGERESRSVAGASAAFLLRGTQSVQGVDFDKWMLIVGAPDTTAVITVQVPQEVEAYPDEAIDAALRSVTVTGAAGVEEQIDALPFRIGDRAGFRAVQVLAGASLILTEGPLDIVKDAAQPLVIVASGLDASVPTPASRDAFARRGLVTLPGLGSVEIEAARAFRLRDADWHRIDATAVDVDDGAPLYVLQVVRFDADGWIRIAAITAAAQREGFAERLLALAQSVEPRR